MKGKNGQHLIIKVPVGTILKNADHEIIFELNEKKSYFISVGFSQYLTI